MEDPTDTHDDLFGRLKGCLIEHIPDIDRDAVDKAQDAADLAEVVSVHFHGASDRENWGPLEAGGEIDGALSDIADLAGLNDWPE